MSLSIYIYEKWKAITEIPRIGTEVYGLKLFIQYSNMFVGIYVVFIRTQLLLVILHSLHPHFTWDTFIYVNMVLKRIGLELKKC